MKKILSLLLAALILVSMTACGGETAAPTTEPTETQYTGFLVPEPLKERPIYTVSENPTIEELRETAVRAMHDMLSIQWSTSQPFMYNKTGAVSHKDYQYTTDTIYCGLPYADGQTNIYVWLEYYDLETGHLRMEGDGQWLNSILGNTCAGSLMWAWSTVCDSLTGPYVNTNMTPAYGCLPVGPYTYPNFDFITGYSGGVTGQICAHNGLDVMFESYAQAKMADAVTNSKSEHTMMLIEDATVVRDAEGNIDPIQSYVMLQDQAAGTGEKFYEHVGEDGNTYHYTGRTGPIAVKMTFRQLFDATYIPVTTAEFLGLETYTKPEVKCSNENAASIDDLFSSTITCNYPMSMIKVVATDANGKKVDLSAAYINRKDVQGSAPGMFDGAARNYKLSGERININSAIEELAAGTYTITVEVTAPNGEIFTPATITMTK